MHKEQPTVHQIKCSFWQRIAPDVVLADLEVGVVKTLEKARVDVRHEDVPAATNPLAHPRGHRTATATNLQAVPALRHTQPFQVPDRSWVVNCFNLGQPLTSQCPGVV